MSKNIYRAGNMKGNQTIMELKLGNSKEYEKTIPAKRVDIVSIRMVKEASFLYKNRKVSSPNDAYNLIKGFFEYVDREELIVCSLDTKNQPNNINTFEFTQELIKLSTRLGE